jgi:hypothetical protein
MAKFLFFFFAISAFIAMWGMYNVQDGTQLCMAILILSLMGMAMSASIWEENIKKKVK